MVAEPLDRRRVGLRLTPAGARMKAAQTVLDPARVRAVLRRLSPSERDQALRGLALLARASTHEIASKSGAGGS